MFSSWVRLLNISLDLFTVRYLFKPMNTAAGNTEAEVRLLSAQGACQNAMEIHFLSMFRPQISDSPAAKTLRMSSVSASHTISHFSPAQQNLFHCRGFVNNNLNLRFHFSKRRRPSFTEIFVKYFQKNCKIFAPRRSLSLAQTNCLNFVDPLSLSHM